MDNEHADPADANRTVFRAADKSEAFDSDPVICFILPAMSKRKQVTVDDDSDDDTSGEVVCTCSILRLVCPLMQNSRT
jgi:hypothetical protein